MLSQGMALLNRLNDLVWGPPLLCLLMACGLYFMIQLKGLPVRKLSMAIRMALEPPDNSKDRGEGISAFSSLATELAATIGTGNIVGVVGAILLGGPGALFWMVAAAFLGLGTKLAESTLSVKYRERRKDGSYLGGPMVTLQKTFPNRKAGRCFGLLYAGLAVLSGLGMGNMVQSNSIACAMKGAFGIPASLTGTVVTFLVLLTVLGGIGSISRLAVYLVPAMGALYLAGCTGVILAHPDRIFPAVFQVIKGAFCPGAVSGGLFGSVVCGTFRCMKWGISRGVFSNEAGLGAAGITAAASREKNYVKQGFISMTGVFFDTIIICTLTGLAFGCSGVCCAGPGELMLRSGERVAQGDGAAYMMAAFESVFGRFGGVLLGTALALFAFATILGWAYQGEQAFLFLSGDRWKLLYRLIYAMFSYLGAVTTLQAVWTVSDLCNGLLAFPNLICLIVLAPEVCRDILSERFC